jgi:hypothetical protein
MKLPALLHTTSFVKTLPLLTLAALILLSVHPFDAAAQTGIRHFIFVERERNRIHDPVFLETKQIAGAQVKYTWRELEPRKNEYHFETIQEDLDFLQAHGKALFVQLQDVSFDSTAILVPRYLRDDPQYNGGADPQYVFEDTSETKYKIDGWVARRWDPRVAARFHELLRALGKRFDGRIEGINLPETAVDFGDKARLRPKGFTPQGYRDAIKETMKVLKESFSVSVTIIYANFMPGEWLPGTDHHYLRDVYEYAKEIHVGMGGPDLLVYKKSQMDHSYGLIRGCDGIVPTGVAVQWGNYEHINPQTGKRVTIPEIFEFGKNYLKLRYIFWYIQGPFYSRDLAPFLRSGPGN